MKCSILTFRTLWICTLAFLLQHYVVLGREGREAGITPLNCSPLSFEENQGQFPDAVKFVSKGFKGHVFLTPTGFQIEIKSRNSASYLGLHFANSNPAVKLEGKETAPGVVSYLLGNNPSKWRTGIPSWHSVIYRELYPGIDLLCYGKDGQLEYDFVLEPCAGADQIMLSFNGQENIEISEEGDLIIQTGSGTIRHTRPLAYQEIDDNKVNVECTYALNSPSSIQFQVAAYDKSRPLIIDPVIVYSTYLGGTHPDRANDVVADNAGNMYVVGTTCSTNFPLSGSPFQEELNQGLNSTNSDVFVSKFSADGSTLVYSTFLGGDRNDDGKGIAVDSEGNVYITGDTKSTNFPIKNAYQDINGGDPAYPNNEYEIFVTKLDETGTNLVFSTYYGSINSEHGNAIDIDAAGNVYIAGAASSGDFPATNGYQTVHGGQVDGVVVKFDTSGTNLVYATYLGGTTNDDTVNIAVDSEGYAYVLGRTTSSNFPTANAWDITYGGGDEWGGDAFLSKFDPMGTSLVYSTYLGGEGNEYPHGICIDAQGCAYVAGGTDSADFPVTNAYKSTLDGDEDIFITTFSASGTQLLYSTYMGGTSNDCGYDIVLDGASNIYVVGYTFSPDFLTYRAFQTNLAGSFDGFITEISADGTNILFSTYFGGDGDDNLIAVAVDPQDFIYAVGYTKSTNFPTVDAFQGEYGGHVGGQSYDPGDAVAIRIGPPYFTAISKSGTGVQMSWRSFSNMTYGVQYRTNLSEGTWAPFTNHTATGLTATVQDSSQATSRFYRVVE